MTKTQKEVKRKKVRATYEAYRFKNLAPKRKQRLEDQKAFMSLIGTPLKN